MDTLDIPLEPGAFGWVVSVMHYRLPDGLPDRSLVKIVRNVPGETALVVMDREGGEWRVLRGNVLPRLRYRAGRDQKWYLESHPSAISRIFDEIHRVNQEIGIQKTVIEDLHWRIRRSGSPAEIARLEEMLAPFAG